jgi:hypothetical protein
MVFQVCSWCVSFWVSHQKFRATKKTAVPNQDRRSMKSEEKFLFGLVTHTSLGVSAFANHRGLSPSPVGILTRLARPQEFLML